MKINIKNKKRISLKKINKFCNKLTKAFTSFVRSLIAKEELLSK
jgi:hypothetical protein